jgi:hypothetical protein
VKLKTEYGMQPTRFFKEGDKVGTIYAVGEWSERKTRNYIERKFYPIAEYRDPKKAKAHLNRLRFKEDQKFASVEKDADIIIKDLLKTRQELYDIMGKFNTLEMKVTYLVQKIINDDYAEIQCNFDGSEHKINILTSRYVSLSELEALKEQFDATDIDVNSTYDRNQEIIIKMEKKQ